MLVDVIVTPATSARSFKTVFDVTVYGIAASLYTPQPAWLPITDPASGEAAMRRRQIAVTAIALAERYEDMIDVVSRP